MLRFPERLKFQQPLEAFSYADLYYLAKNGSNPLKLYSSQELMKRNDKRFLEIYEYYLNYSLVIKYKDGCVGTKNSFSQKVYTLNTVTFLPGHRQLRATAGGLVRRSSRRQQRSGDLGNPVRRKKCSKPKYGQMGRISDSLRYPCWNPVFL